MDSLLRNLGQHLLLLSFTDSGSLSCFSLFFCLFSPFLRCLSGIFCPFFMKTLALKQHHLGWGAELCPGVGRSEPAGTSWGGHRAGPSCPRPGGPCPSQRPGHPHPTLCAKRGTLTGGSCRRDSVWNSGKKNNKPPQIQPNLRKARDRSTRQACRTAGATSSDAWRTEIWGEECLKGDAGKNKYWGFSDLTTGEPCRPQRRYISIRWCCA